jgi:hypothetical protein
MCSEDPSLPRRIDVVAVRLHPVVPDSAAADSSRSLGRKRLSIKCRLSARRSHGSTRESHLRRRTVASVTLLPFMPRGLIAVAPLRQWSHDPAMHLGKDPVDQARHSSWRAMSHSESGCVSALRHGDITTRCSGTGFDKVHARHGHASIGTIDSALVPHHPPAELGR